MFSTLGLYPSGVDRKQLDVDDPDVPDALAELCIDMETIATGTHVVPGYLEVRKIASPCATVFS